MARLRIAALGWFDHQNVGDEAFKYALIELFPDADITFVNNIPKFQGFINSCDYLLIGGGNIVSPEFLRGLGLVKIPYSFIGIGVVSTSQVGLLAGAEHVLVRDQASYNLVVGSRPDAILIPDLAFSLTPDREEGRVALAHLPGINPARPTVGVFLNDCVSAKFDSTILKFIECEKIKLELSRFLEGLPANVLFLPMSTLPPDDRRISLDVIGKMKNGYKYHCITESIQPLKCLDMVSALDFAITMRLHADIFCTIAGVPFLDLVHHDKSKGYLESLDESILSTDYYGLNLGVLQEKFTYLTENREEISRRLMAKAATNKSNLGVSLKNVPIPRGRTDKAC
jgi:polysaccharide pyruvyl transferase WcaK-like protein